MASTIRNPGHMASIAISLLLPCVFLSCGTTDGTSVAVGGSTSSAPGATATPTATATATATATPAFTTGQAASVVIGETSMTGTASGVTASLLSVPVGVSISSSGSLFIAEQSNSRVLVFNSLPTSNGASADSVIGQSSLTWPGTGSAASTLWAPEGVSVSGSQVFVADTDNSRVLIYNSVSTGVSASFAVGQSTTATGTDPGGSVMSTTLRFPSAVFSSGTQMVIADSSYNRVTLYNSIPTASGAAADVVIGQANKNSSASGVSTMSSPRAVWTDGTRIVVCDMNNHRVLIWNSWPSADGTAPDVILGQSSMTTNTYNNGGISASTLYSPQGVASNGTELYISDNGNNRVLYWKTWPTTNMQAADVVLGQPDFVTATTGTTSTTLNSPVGLYLYGTQLVVTDSGNNRVLIYDKQ